MTSNVDIHSRFVNALRTQAKTADAPSESLPCPYCTHQGALYQSPDHLFDHVEDEHMDVLQAMDAARARARVREEALKVRAAADRFSGATVGGSSAPDLGNLTLLETAKRPTPPIGRKRPSEIEHHARRGKMQGSVDIYDPDSLHEISHTVVSERPRPKQADSRLYDPKQSPKGNLSPYRTTPDPSSEWSVEANRSQLPSPKSILASRTRAQIQHRSPAPRPQHAHHAQRQPGLLEIQRSDPRYPGLLLQPDSRPISQEQLGSEVKSIYAGLTLVETKCIHVDRDQAAALQNREKGPNAKLGPDHWQALIALHRTLLHEHHDFFLASQHPSASPALRRLASKYSMPARMWKHGIHSFLELLRQQLPESIDFMLAFIYLAYQMMALLYETVPAFEDTWIECLGDLGRYRMAIEDEDIRDREIWAGRARSWYSKAADKNPNVGRLYHHLAILARPNALQQLYYYARSLACVKTFPSARESILTLLDPILEHTSTASPQKLPVETFFIQAHAILFKKLSPELFEDARVAFESQLDMHIGRVTTKWKEQGIWTAVTNIAGLFDYGSEESVLRQILLLHGKELKEQRSSRAASPTNEEQSHSPNPTDHNSTSPTITEHDVPSQLDSIAKDFTFSRAYLLTMSTFSLVLNRIGDKNVLPHVHVNMSFLFSFASITYVSHLINEAPWSELASFLNGLLKSERSTDLMSGPLFPSAQSDDLRLPEDYLIRGQIWSQWYFPARWFEGEHDEEERYLEPPSTRKIRTERVLRLGYQLAALSRWLSYDAQSRLFSAVAIGSP